MLDMDFECDLVDAAQPPQVFAGVEHRELTSLDVHFQQSHRTYSEIVWLEAGWTTPTRANANQTTGLPNSYGPTRSIPYLEMRSAGSNGISWKRNGIKCPGIEEVQS